MRNPALVSFLFLAVLLSSLSPVLIREAEAQTREELSAQTQWMNAWSSWMGAMGQTNARAKMVEAYAKLTQANAAMVTAVAGANKTNAEALQALEQARSLAWDNNRKKAEVFYEKRALHDAYHQVARPRPSRPTEDDLNRYSQAALPKRLTEDQFDLLRGEIVWPSLLRREQFSQQCAQIRDLFVNRLVNEDIHSPVQQITDEMQAELLSLLRQREAPANEYIKAKRFVQSLAYESRFEFQAPDPRGNLAAR